MKKRYQVFISSTFLDLQPARQEVSQALLRSGCFPAGMELFPAADTEQFEYIKEIIDESDYYILITAGRYGSIDKKTGLSYTEMEYDYALRREKPIIRLLHIDPFNHLRGEFLEKTDAGRAALEAFRAKLKEGRMVRFWSDPKELGAEVLHGIEDAKKRRPAPGWIQANAVTPSHDELRDSIISMGQALRAGTDVFLDRFPYPVVRTNRFGEVLYVNRVAARVTDRFLDVGLRIEDLFDGLARPVAEIFAEGRESASKEMLRAKIGGEDRHFEVTFSKMDDLDHSLLAVFNDLTDLKSLEGEFAQSQKMQAIGQLAGGVAHDFNNLLTAISVNCQLLLMRHDPGDEDYGELAAIDQVANRAAALVSQLLAFSRKQNLRPEVLDIRGLLDELHHLLNRLIGEHIAMTIDYGPGVGHVKADGRQLEQVVMNLVVNARDAMPEGGTIEITTAPLSFDKPVERQGVRVPAGRYVAIRVSDQGEGIAPEHLDKVFEPFFTTKPSGEGTGLGLSTVYGIVKQTGGYITLETALGQGTTVEVLLPEHGGDSPVKVPSYPHVKLPEKASGVILYAEDDEDVRVFTLRGLTRMGFTVRAASSGDEALALLREDGGAVDAILTDVVMPGLSGPEWVAEALDLCPDLPVLFVSGYAEESFQDGIAGIAGAAFLPKPYSLSQLVSTLARMVRT